MIDLKKTDKSWTLFIDRDGVINHEKHNDYIHSWDEFVFYEGVLEAFEIFNRHFYKIIIVTNQKGVGKGVTLLKDLVKIHDNMKAVIENAGGRIDAIYFCTDLDDGSPHRKPNPGMGWKAKADFPEIDFSKSIMVGNTMSDMLFGRNLAAKTVFLPTTRPEVDITDKNIDDVYDSLISFAKALSAGKL